MDKRGFEEFFSVGLLIVFSLFLILISYAEITGKVVSEEITIGPSIEVQNCMSECMNCTSRGVGCTGNSEECIEQCNAEKPEETDETNCMEKCVLKGCSEFDFECQEKNKETCEEECDMVKEPEASSEEEQCIRDCVAKVDSSLQCQNSAQGETGNEVCKRCAKECVYLYAGPCLNDEELRAKEKECETCEHCYGEPVMGDSGEGFECVVEVECKDATSEWGDAPLVGGIVGDAIQGIVDFFKGLFGGDKSKVSEEREIAEDQKSETSTENGLVEG